MLTLVHQEDSRENCDQVSSVIVHQRNSNSRPINAMSDDDIYCNAESVSIGESNDVLISEMTVTQLKKMTLERKKNSIQTILNHLNIYRLSIKMFSQIPE